MDDFLVYERFKRGPDTEAAEEDDEGDPDDPQKVLERQLRCIRNRETVDRLRVPLPGSEGERHAAQ